MYRIEDIEKIDKNINKIKNAAAKEYKNHYEPTLTEMSQVYNAIKKYIIKNKKIVYGGFAQKHDFDEFPMFRKKRFAFFG